MADSIVVILSSSSSQALGTAFDLLAAAAALEMELHIYFTGAAVVWVGRPDGEESDRSEADAIRQDVTKRLRELKKDTTVNVYACSRAMKTHGVSSENLTPEVDMPAGFVYILDLASRANIALNF
jgi:peroxiredoxin family protein